MQDTLREQLNLPIIGGEVVAHIFNPDHEGFNKFGRVLSDYMDEVWKLKAIDDELLHLAITYQYVHVAKAFKKFSKEQLSKKIEELQYSNLDLLGWYLEIFNDSQFHQYIFEQDAFVRNQNEVELNILYCEERIQQIQKAVQKITKLFGNKTEVAADFALDNICIPDAIELAFPDEKWKSQRIDWYLRFAFSGPDRRYLDGSTRIDSLYVKDFVEDLKIALKKLKTLENTNFVGDYDKIICQWTNGGKLSVSASAGNATAEFWVASKNYEYSQSLSRLNLEKVIEMLYNIEERGKVLIKTLKQLLSS